MSLKRVLSELNFNLNKEEKKELDKKANEIVDIIKKTIKKKKIKADVFIGGSLAKNTVVKSTSHEIDIFIRFDWKYEDLSEHLDKLIRESIRGFKFKIEKVHGSRDYFKLWASENLLFEIIPVLNIKKPKEARNVTDLSYFHVAYVKKHTKNAKIAKEIVNAKSFFKAAGVYGAESYINGFSGYATECLIIYYRSLEKMLKEIAKSKERIIIDIEKDYKNKKEIEFELNESKIKGPIVLIDPTWKERNVLAALNNETFDKLKIIAKELLKKPDKEFFELKDFDKSKFISKNRNTDYLKIEIQTDKQEGDIAGTKLKKFSRFILTQLEEYAEVYASEFVYGGQKKADLHLLIKPKSEILRKGPPVEMTKAAENFKKMNKKVFEKDGSLYTKIAIPNNSKEVVKMIVDKNQKTMKDMNIFNIKINN